MRVLFRADAAPEIGTGHIVRCLALARVLREQGAEVHFACRQLPIVLRDRIQDAGCQIDILDASAPLDDSADAGAVRQSMGSDQFDWVVVDHYALGIEWERRLRDAADRLLVIDDLARPHDCDVLLDQNLQAEGAQRYQGRLPVGAGLLLGPRYALLRPEFAALAARTPPRDGPVRRVFLFMGGIDQVDATSTVLDALERVDRRGAAVDVVIGSAHPRKHQIEARCASHRFACHVDATNMADLMAAADLAIGAGGTATWERCSLGLPTIAICVAENQRELLANASRAGLLYSPDAQLLSPQLLAAHIQALLDSSGLRSFLSRMSASLVDGRGSQRVAAAMLPHAIVIRPATAVDCQPIHEWRNHPVVRNVSREQGVIPFAEHKHWFERVLQDETRSLLIGEREGRPVGVVRFDDSGSEAEVSVYVVPERIGYGEGPVLLQAAEDWLKAHRPHVKLLRAEVLEGNMASGRLFERCGFVRDCTRFSKRLVP